MTTICCLLLLETRARVFNTQMLLAAGNHPNDPYNIGKADFNTLSLVASCVE